MKYKMFREIKSLRFFNPVLTDEQLRIENLNKYLSVKSIYDFFV